MPDFYALALLSTTLSLCSWMTFDKKWKISSFFQILFFMSFTAYVCLFFLGAGLGLKLNLFTLFRDLIFISGTSAIFFMLKRNTFISFFFLIGLFAASPQIYDYLAKTKKKTPKQEVSSDWELLLETYPGEDIANLNSIISKYSLKLEKAFDPQDGNNTDLDDYYSVNIPPRYENKFEKIKRELSRNKSVEWIEPNEMLKLSPIESVIQKKKITQPLVNDPFIEYQWAYEPLEMNAYFEYINKYKIKPAKKSKLFILDTGIDSRHEDLNGYYHSYDKSHDKDDIGHGTHCAGIAAAVTNNKIGVASLIPNDSYVSLSGIRVISSLGFGTQKMVIDGIIKAVDAGADVISLSLGGKSSQTREKAYNQAMAYAKEHGTIVVVAAGNSGTDASNYSPANSQNVITVAATDQSLNRTYFSNTLENIQYGISAPGQDIYSTYPGNQYKALSGTSMATPFVSGLVAMMRSVKPEIQFEEIYEILHNTGLMTTEQNKTGKIIQPYKVIQIITQEKLN